MGILSRPPNGSCFMATNLISLPMEYFDIFFFIYTRPAKLPGKCCEHQQKRVELLFKAADKSEKTRKFIELAFSSARMCGFSCLSSLRGTKIFSVIPKIFRLAMSRLINRKKSSDVLLIRNYRRRLAGGPFRDVILGGIGRHMMLLI